MKLKWYEGELLQVGVFAETKKAALKNSIKKWQMIVRYFEDNQQAPIQTGGPQTCNLCHLYFMEDCPGCPVFEVTEIGGCEGTPYDEYERLQNHEIFVGENQPKKTVNKMHYLAKKELAFLESLLKEMK
jgi:hypothetical protein